MFANGDSVTVTNTTGQADRTIGRTGTVVQVDTDNDLITVKGIDDPITEYLLGERAYPSKQLRRN